MHCRFVLRIVVVGAGVVFGSCLASASPVAAAAATEAGDPVLIRQTLPNGLKVVIVPRATEPGRISLRLVVHAGSLDEREDERGFAHFVEHMAFNGTTHYPAGKLVPFFQRIGLAWGADVNAETSCSRTIYKLDLPAGHAAHLSEALTVLADFAGGARLESKAVERERHVLLRELDARDNDEAQILNKRIDLLYAGTSIPSHLPGGDREVVAGADSARLRAFYERCYRPERMTLLVVGDVSSELAAKSVQQHFGSLRGRGVAAPPVPGGRPDVAGLHADVATSPLSPSATASVQVVVPVEDDTPATIEAALGSSVVISVLNRRLGTRRESVSQRIGRALAFMTEGVDGRYLHYGMEAHASVSDWPLAVEFVETELRRAREQGFTVAELQEAVTSILVQFRASAAASGGLPADQLAQNIASVIATGRQWRGPYELLKLAENYLATFNPALADATLRSVFRDESIHVIVTSRTAPEGGEAAVMQAYRASGAQALTKPEDTVVSDLLFRYGDFGSPGGVASNTHDALGIDLVRFENNVRLNARRSDTEPKQFKLTARIGRGVADIPRDLPSIHHLGMALLICCDLGRHSQAELHRLVELQGVTGAFNFEGNDFTIQLSGPAKALPFALQLLTARLSDPKLAPEKLPEAVSLYPALVGSMLGSTLGYTQAETLFRATDSDPRFRIATQTEVQKYPFDTVVRWMKEHWLDGPLEVGIVGDFAPAEVIAAAAASIGTLSPGRSSEIAKAERLAPLTKTHRNLSYIDLPDKTAAVRLFWAFQRSSNRKTDHALRIAAAGLQERLRVTLREKLGVTYGTASNVYRDLTQPEFGLVTVDVTFDPAQAFGLAERTIELAQEFGRKGLSKEEFMRARTPLKSMASAELRSNAWWLERVLQNAQTDPGVLEEARVHDTGFATVTREEVNRAARLFATEANCVGFVPRSERAPVAK